MMDLTVFKLLCLVLASVCVWAIVPCWRKLMDEPANSWRGGVWFVPLLLAVFAALGFGLGVVFNNPYPGLFDGPGAKYFDRDGRLIGVVSDGLIVRRSQQPPGTAFVIGADERTVWRWDVPMKVSPITPNPKVRELHYSVRVGVALDTPAMTTFLRERRVPLERGLNMLDQEKETTETVRYFLYEFNERHSKELAVFYNPLYDGQQEEFTALVRAYLEPKLAHYGLTVESARFSLP